jgi:hypothetical protein
MSCKPKDPSNLVGEDHVKWTFSLEQTLGKEIVETAVPAFDENNKGYFIVETENGNLHDLWVLAIRPDSSLHWKVKVSDSDDPSNYNYISYSDGKILVNMTNKLIRLDTLSGNQIWSKNIFREYWVNTLSVSDGKVFYIESTSPDKLVGLNLDNGSEICNIELKYGTSNDVRGQNTVIKNGKLYVTTNDIDNTNTWETKVLIYDINTINSSSLPDSKYDLPEDYFHKNDPAISSAGNLLFFMKDDYNSPYTKYLVSVSTSGTENWKKEVPDEALNIYIDNLDNVYCVTNSISLIKFNSSGTKQYQTDYPYTTNFNLQLLNNNTFYGNTGNAETGEDLNIFTVFSLSNGNEVSNFGTEFPYLLIEGIGFDIEEANQKLIEENTNFAQSLVKTVDIEGNIISISKNKIYCVEDLDIKLQTNSWSKDYGDIGNTNSR